MSKTRRLGGGGKGVGTLRGGNFVAEYAEKVTWMSLDMGRNTLNLRECNQKKRNQGLGFWQSWAVDVCEDGNQRCGSNVLCDDCVWDSRKKAVGVIPGGGRPIRDTVVLSSS